MSNSVQRRAARRRSTFSQSAYQSLEARQLLAGDVTVFDGDHLFIRGDSNDNQIEIIGNEDGTISIIGRDDTTVNGSPDPLVIQGDTNFVNSDNNVRASYAGGIRANVGAGHDSLLIEGVEFRDNSIIYGGGGDDSIGAYQTNFSDRLLIQTFTGNDDVSLDVTSVQLDLYVMTLDGEDTVGIDASQLAGDVYVVTGNNDDATYLRQNTINEDLLVLTQNGADFMALEDNVVGATTGAYMGDGVDEASLTFQNLAFVNDTRIGGQAGNDSFELDGSFQNLLNVQVRTFESDQIDNGSVKRQDVMDDLIANGARLGTITQLVNLTPSLATLSDSFARTGLDVEFSSPATRSTLFAPTDAAFANLPGGTLDNLTDLELGDILRYHAVGESIFAERLATLPQVTTLLNQILDVDLVGQDIVLNSDATITTTDIRVKNGVVHLIDEVLIPIT